MLTKDQVGTDRPDTAFDLAKEYLLLMGNPNSIFLCGGVGAGVSFKIINNYISAIASLASSEALNVGVKMGLDPKRLTEVINASGYGIFTNGHIVNHRG